MGPPGSGTERIRARIADEYLHEDGASPIWDDTKNVRLTHFNFEDILASALKTGTESKLQAKVDQIKGKPGKKLKLTTRTRLVKKHLMSNRCRYRGYVLEGYPSNYEEAKALFTEKAKDPDADDAPPEEEEESDVPEEEEGAEAAPPPADEEEDENAEEEKRELNKAICPEYVIVLSSTEENCKKRIFEGGVRLFSEGGFTSDEAAFMHQTQEYRKANLLEDGSAGTPEFFEEDGGIKVLKVDVDVQSEEELFQATRVYIESQGNFFNYLRSEEDVVRERLEAIAQKERAEKEASVVKTQAEKAVEEAMRNQRSAQEAAQRNVITEAEAAMLESETTPLRQYLMHYVVPTLTDGMLDASKEMPEDPIEHLAQYLFTHAQDIAPQLEAAASRR